MILGSCYYGGDYVTMTDGQQKRIDHLQIGDQIWSLSQNGHHLIQDEIILMMHTSQNQSG